MKLITFFALACVVSQALAAPVQRTFWPRVQADSSASTCDVDGDGVTDFTLRAFPGITFGFERHYWTSVTVRDGFEFLMESAAPQRSIWALGAVAPFTVGPTPSAGAWSQPAELDERGVMLGGETHNGWPSNTQTRTGILANTRWPYVGFRLTRNGQTYYGVLDTHRYPAAEPVVTPSPPGVPVVGTLVNFHVSFGAAIIESSPDTPVVITQPELALRGGTVALPPGTTKNFGSVDLGGFKTAHFTLVNEGSAPLNLLSTSVTGADAAEFLLDPPPTAELAPGASTALSVTFVPGVEQKVSTASLVINSNDPGKPSASWPIIGTAGTRLLPVKIEEVGGHEITPLSAAVDFGSPMVGQSVTKTFRITNLGSAPLVAPRWQVEEPTGPLPTDVMIVNSWLISTGPIFSGFRIANNPPYTIAAGQSATLTLRWIPYETISKTRTVRLTASNASAKALLVTGAALPYTHVAPKLAGLHYRFGAVADVMPETAFEQRQTYLSDQHLAEPAGLTPLTSHRWHYSGWNPPVPTEPEHSWRARASSMLALHSGTLPGNPKPKHVLVSGAPSGWDKMGSRMALEFGDGSHLRGMSSALKLPANDRVGMELWMKPLLPDGQPVAGAQCVSFIGLTPDTGFGIWMVDGVLEGRAGASRAAMTSTLSSEWHHVALLFQGGRLTLRVDGAEVASTANASLPEPTIQFTVGAMLWGEHPAKVQIDELRLFELEADFDPLKDLLITAKPAVSADKTALDFGSVPLGSPAAKVFTLTNAGPGWLRIVSATITGAGAGDYVCQSAGNTLFQPDRPPLSAYWGGFSRVSTLTDLSSNVIEGIGGPMSWWSGTDSVLTALAPGAAMVFKVIHVPSALGPRPATFTLTTDDPTRPTVELALTSTGIDALPPRLETSITEWAWGTAATDQTRSQTIYISNSGGAALAQVSAQIVGPHAGDFALGSSFTMPGDLPPFRYALGVPPVPVVAPLPGPEPWIAPLRLFVGLQPRAAGPRLAWLRITSNDPVRPVLDIPMFGQGEVHRTEIEVQGQLYYPDRLAEGAKPIPMQGTMDFGNLMRTTEMSAGYVRTHNTGTRPLTVSRVTVSGPNASDFVLDPAGTGIMQPTQWGSTTVKFKPTAEGLRTATLRIESNDEDESIYEIQLTGRMLPPTPVLVVNQGGLNATSLEHEFLRLGTGVVRGFRKAGYALPTKTLRLSNTGTGALTNARVSVIGPNADEFTAWMPATLDIGASVEIFVRFDPKDIGPRTATLRIESDAGLLGEVSVGGTGAYSERASLAPDLPAGWVTTAMAEMPDGGVLIAGYTATPVSGGIVPRITPDHRLFRVGRDGSVAPFGHAAYPVGTNGIIRSIAVRADGLVVLAGEFSEVMPSTTGAINYVTAPPRDGQGRGRFVTRYGVAAFGANGVVSAKIGTDEGDFVGRAVVALPDGKVLVGGSGSLGGRKNLIRLNADGTLDPTFTLPEPDGPVNALALQEDGKVLVGGEFTNLGQPYVPGPLPQLNMVNPSLFVVLSAPLGPLVKGSEAGLCRLNADGTNDTSFGNPGFRSVTALAVQKGRIAVGGVEKYEFPYVGFWPEAGQSVEVPTARLLTLSGQTLARTDTQRTPRAVALQPGDRMHVAPGNAAAYPLPLHPSVGLVQPISTRCDFWGILSRPTQPSVTHWDLIASPISTLFHFQQLKGEIHALLPQSDGKLLVGGALSEASVDAVSSDNWSVVIPPSSKTLINGFVQLESDGFLNQSTHRLPKNIGLTGRDGVTSATLSSGDSRDFGTADVGSETSLTVSLSNLGTASMMTPATITIMGMNAADFILSKSPTYPIAAGLSSDFVVTFKPKANGKVESIRNAVLQIGDGSAGAPIAIALFGTAKVRFPVIADLADQMVLSGQGIAINADVLGAAPLNLQWLKDGKPIANATSATLIILNSTLRDAGTYSLRATNSFGSMQSQAARVVVVDGQSQSILKPAGASVTMECKAAGSGLTYRWFFNNHPLLGATAAKLTLKSVTAAHAGTYTCAVSLGSQRITGPTNQLTIVGLPEITSGLENTNWMVNQDVQERFTSLNAGPVRWAVRGLPPGVMLNAETGALTGRPAAAGTYRLIITATNVAGRSPVLVQSVTVLPWPAGFVGTFHGVTMQPNEGVGGSPSGDWTLTGTAAGTFTMKRRTVVDSASDARASKNPPIGSMKTESFSGIFNLQLVSDTDRYATAAIPIYDGAGELYVSINIVGSDLLAEHNFILGNNFSTGQAWPVMKKVEARFAGSYRRTVLEDTSGKDSKGMFAASISPRAEMTWVVKLGPSFGGFTATASCPMEAGPAYDVFTVFAFPSSKGMRAVNVSGKLMAPPAQKPKLTGNVTWYGGTLLNPGALEETFSFDALKF